MKPTITNEQWEAFFHVLFSCAGDEEGLRRLCIPLWAVLEANGHGPSVQQYLEAPATSE